MMDHEKTGTIVRLEKKNLKRVLRPWDLFSVGYGDVGSSIYYALGATALFAAGATPLALFLAGLVFICTALTYAEMTSTFPEPGGVATFSRHAFNDLISFIAGWALLLDYIVTLAISAFAVPPYLAQMLSIFGISYKMSDLEHCIFTIAIIGGLFLLNLLGVKHSGRFSFFLTMFTIITQGLIILFGCILILNLPHIIAGIKIGVGGASPSWIEFSKGCAMAMVAYTGIEAITQLSAEAKNPGVSIPKAIKWTAAVILVLHVGLSVISLSVLSPLELGTTYLEDPIAGVARNLPIGGSILAPWVGLLAAMILLVAANAGLLGCSRLMFSMGEYYQVPSFFHQLHKKFHTPYITLAFFTIIAACVVGLSRGKMLFLTDLYNFGAQLAFFFVHLSLLALRIKKPHLERPYKAPWNIPIGKGRSLSLTAMVGLFATFATWIIVIVTKVEGRILGFSWLFLGGLIYFFYRKRHHMALAGRTIIEKIRIPAYHPMKIRHILVAARSLSHTEALQTAFQLAKIHGAEVTVMSVLEIPNALPMNAPLPEWEKLSEEVLKRAEAIGREYHIAPRQELVRARSLETALIKTAEKENIDLIILSAEYKEFQRRNRVTSQTSDLLKHSKCPVLFCRT